MSSKICLQISELNEDELLESMNLLVMQLEQRFGGEEIDELLYQLIAQRVTRIYSDKSEEYGSSTAQIDSFCFDLEHAMGLEEHKSILNGVLAGIEMQLGSVTAEKLMYQIMYRLGVRNGKYSEEQEDDTDDSSEYNVADEEDAVLSTSKIDECIDNKYKLHERQRLSYIKNLRYNHKVDNDVHSMESNDEDMNRANEEFEQRAKNLNEKNEMLN